MIGCPCGYTGSDPRHVCVAANDAGPYPGHSTVDHSDAPGLDPGAMHHAPLEAEIARLTADIAAEREQREVASRERDLLRYWLLRLFLAANREGWEDGPSEAETRSAIADVLANHDADPHNPKEAEAVLAAGAEYHTGPGAARTRDDAATVAGARQKRETLEERLAAAVQARDAAEDQLGVVRGMWAEAEAREQRLRESVETFCKLAQERMLSWQVLENALAEPADGSALRAHVAAAVERVVQAAHAAVFSGVGEEARRNNAPNVVALVMIAAVERAAKESA